MENGIFRALINNGAVLLALSAVFETAYFLPARYQRFKTVFSGILIAGACIAVMAAPFRIQSGIIFDTRSILISVTALIFGPVPASITAAAALAFRLFIGGIGTWAGSASILSSALVGLAWRRWVYPRWKGWRWLNVWTMSVCVHLALLACQFLLPYPDNIRIIRVIALPVMLVYPAVTVMLSLLLLRQQAFRGTQRQLAQSEERFRMLFDKAPLGYQSLDDEGRFLDVNQQWCTLLGYGRDEVIGKWFGDFLVPENREAFARRFPLFKEQGHIHSEFKMLHRDGTPLHIAFEGRIGYGPDGAFKQTHCILQDITAQKASEAALAESERSKSVLLANLQGMAYRCRNDRDWTMQFVSAGCRELTGYAPEDLVDNRRLSFNDMISPEYRELLRYEWDKRLADRQPFRYEYELVTARGRRKWVLEIGRGVYNDRGEIEALEGIVLDISDRKEIEDHLVFVNEHDMMTGLYNLKYLEALLHNDTREWDGRSKALVSINLSMVQLLAANYGFNYTQNLINEAARVLRGYCTESRRLFKAYENRFVFYLTGYWDSAELAAFGEALAETLESVFVTDRISGGIGIVEIRPDEMGVDADVLLRRLLIASERSLSASHRSFDVTFYNRELEAVVNREGEVRHALSAAVMNEPGHELFLQYQPIVDLRTNAIVAFEALARLRTKQLGLVSPVEFIPVAEKTKLIIPLGESVFRRAFGFLRQLMRDGYDEIGVSVNVSVIQLLKPDFVKVLIQLMEEMQVHPGSVGIEITESIFTSEYASANRAIDKLRAIGVQIAIDDFGTGYSSLARQKELKVDCLKIDKFFIDLLMNTEPGGTMTGDIISMAHNLGHCVVAEGVEHPGQMERLRELRCDRAQGYLLSRPLDEEDACRFLGTRGQSGRHSAQRGEP